MYVVLGTIKVRPEHLADFLHHVRIHAEASAAETGCVRYDVLQDSSDPLTVCLYEVFRSEQDFEAHRREPHYQTWMARSRDWRDRTIYSRRVLRNIYPDDSGWDLRS